MSLDWIPLNRPREGCEEEFWTVMRRLQDAGLSDAARRSLLDLIATVSIAPSQVVGAPQIGRSLEADHWYCDQRRAEGWSEQQIAEGLRLMYGCHVVDLAPECDGVPAYSNGQALGPLERYSFRAELLNAVEHIIGAGLVEEAYHSKHADELVDFGSRLLQCADEFAWQSGINAARRPAGQFNEDRPIWQHDIIRSAALWCLYWGRRGHGLHAIW